MKNKKGFTLIELLAVIVILAIIALIAVPVVLNMIAKARKSAVRTSALGYVDAIEYYSGFSQISNDAGLDYNIPLPEMTNGQATCTKTTSGWNNECSNFFTAVDGKSKGDKPTTATIVISSNGKVLSGTTMKFGKYDVNYDGKDATVGGESNSGEGSSTPEPISIDILNSGKIDIVSYTDNHHTSHIYEYDGNTFWYMWVWERTAPANFYYRDKITVNQGERYKIYGKAAVWWNCSTHERLKIGYSTTTSADEDYVVSQTLPGTFSNSSSDVQSETLNANLQDFEVIIDEPGEYYIKGTLKQTSLSCSAYSGITELKLEQIN